MIYERDPAHYAPFYVQYSPPPPRSPAGEFGQAQFERAARFNAGTQIACFSTGGREDYEHANINVAFMPALQIHWATTPAGGCRTLCVLTIRWEREYANVTILHPLPMGCGTAERW